MNLFVRSKGSIAHLIQYSDVWSHEYNRHVKAIEDNPVSAAARFARNLRVCKHRMESSITPMLRCTMYLHAILNTCLAIAVKRKGRQEAAHSLAFLSTIDEEACVQLAMIVDAATEGMTFKGYWDSEAFHCQVGGEFKVQYQGCLLFQMSLYVSVYVST